MLHAGLDGIQSIGSAKVGDKTLLDALVPAIEAFDDAIAVGRVLRRLRSTTLVAGGREPVATRTIDLVAKIGRVSRLGDRSLGVLDAGATSCAIILKQLCRSAQETPAASSATRP